VLFDGRDFSLRGPPFRIATIAPITMIDHDGRGIPDAPAHGAELNRDWYSTLGRPPRVASAS
jgi:hypothetical protein